MAAKKRSKKKSAVKSNSRIGPKKGKTRIEYPKPPKPKKAKRRKNPARVAAGKKGWITRRKRPFEQVIKDAIKKAKADKKKGKRKAPPKWMTEMSKEQLIETLAAAAETAHFVPYHDPEYLHSGRRGNNYYPPGSIAIQPSRARHLGRVTDDALRRMRKAKRESIEIFDIVVRELADELNLPVREIYTLWYSP